MPTGANATLELYQRLVDFARRHNIVIVNDNPYSFILNKKPISILNIPGAKECCIEFNSMSKSHNMPGWRVGLLATNATFVQWILKIKSNIDSGTFRPMQLAAAQAYQNSAEWHEEANIQVYSRRRKLAEDIMTTLGCTFDPEQVGMFLWGKIPDSYADVEELTERYFRKPAYSSHRDSSSAVTANVTSVSRFVPRKTDWPKPWKELKISCKTINTFHYGTRFTTYRIGWRT